MEIAIVWLPIIGGAIIAIVGVWYTMSDSLTVRDKSISLWACALGSLFIGLGFVLHMQQSIWKGDASEQNNVADIVANATTKAAAIAERPWLSIQTRIIGPMRFDKNGGRIGLEFTTRNTGKSPAVGVRTVFEIISLNTLLSENNGDVSTRSICTEARKLDRPGRGVIFPANELVERYDVGFGNEEIAKHRQLIKAKGITDESLIMRMPLVLIGCVDYGFNSHKNGHHQTGFAYDIIGVDQNHPAERFMIDTRVTTQVERLALTKSIIGKEYAD